MRALMHEHATTSKHVICMWGVLLAEPKECQGGCGENMHVIKGGIHMEETGTPCDCRWCLEWYGMVWYGALSTPWTAIVATRWWQLDRPPAEHAQTESVPSALRRWVSFPLGQAPAVA
jgi:hypothetical protein